MRKSIPKSFKKLNLILDIDNTLISSIPANILERTPRENLRHLSQLNTWNMSDNYLVVERPYLQPFLDYVFDNFTVSFWTAATENYARNILQRSVIPPSSFRGKIRKPAYVFHLDHCNSSVDEFNRVKDLRLLCDVYGVFDRGSTLIIDDLDEVSYAQPNDSIRIPAFEALNPSCIRDNALLRIMNNMKISKTLV